MRKMPAYTEYHPKWYRARLSTYWWLGRRPYRKFILRELSSVFVAIWVGITLLQIRAVIAGPQAYADFQNWLKRPLLLCLSAICFLFVLFHTLTWFKAAPQAMVFRIQGKRVPGALILAANYFGWLALSGVVAWVVLRS